MSVAALRVSTDLRLTLLGVCAWAGALLGLVVALHPVWVLVLVGAGLAGGAITLRRGVRPAPHHVAWLIVALAAGLGSGVRLDQVRDSAVAALARTGAVAHLECRVDADAVVRVGTHGNFTMVKATVMAMEGRGRRYRSEVPVLLIGNTSLAGLRYDDVVTVTGRLQRAASWELAAVVSVRGSPRVATRSAWWAGPDGVRRAVRASVARRSPTLRALVPALVDGDDTGLPETTVSDFRAAGLTHLLAVSGTNLSLMLGFGLLLARVVGVRARGQLVAGVVVIVGFVLVARPEPSVLRAAVMGSVALVGMSAGSRRGLRSLGAAVLVLILLDPWLCVSLGFALSVAATAGILWWGPPWREALRAWLPTPVADAFAIPMAAQIACLPLITAISGQVSLVAVLANVLAAPAVGPATVFGLAAGVLGSFWPWAGQALGTAAALCAWWIVQVATWAAGLPNPVLGWSQSWLGITGLTLASLVVARALRPVLRHRTLSVGAAAGLAVVVLLPWGRPGWPPPGWVMVACDVGQGDGLVLRAGSDSAVVVDVGPDPRLMDRCLDRLGVRAVPTVVLTHFHLDHVGGLAGVLAGRRVGEVVVTDLAAPADQVDAVRALCAQRHLPIRLGRYLEEDEVGELRWQFLAPHGDTPADSDSPPNDASLVMLASTRGVSLLMMGDEEGPSQARLRRGFPDLHADVLKVAHHGSSRQDPALLANLGARLAVISVGADNDYGHPAASTLSLLRQEGMTVTRTDQDGDVAVVVATDGSLRVATSTR